MTIKLQIEAEDLAELGKVTADIARACGAGTVTLPQNVDPWALTSVLQAWADPREADVRFVGRPRIEPDGSKEMGRRRYLTIEEMEKRYAAMRRKATRALSQFNTTTDRIPDVDPSDIDIESL